MANYCIRSTKNLWSRYFVTTPEPRARLVLTQGLTWQNSENSKQLESRKEKNHPKNTQSFHFIMQSEKKTPEDKDFILISLPILQADFVSRKTWLGLAG